MTDCQMPVLTEQEREIQIAEAKALMEQIIKDCSVGWTADRGYLVPLQIALASLTAEPVDPADCFQPVYLVPPVPVIKHEGEQRD